MSDFFDSATLSRGLQYATDGRATIEEIDVADTSLYVYGKCQGTRKRPYEVDVWLDIDPETGTVSRLDSECSCPVGTQCKHGVAVVLNALVQGVAPLRGGDETSLLPAEADFEPSQAAIDWLKEFDASPPMPMPQPTSGSRLIYQLDPEHSSITVGKSRCLRKGGFGKPSPYMPTYNYQVRGSGDPVQPEDVPVLKLCTACQGPAHYYQRELVAELKGEAGFLLLRQAARTGRLFVIGDMERPLREGGARRIELEWRRDPQRRQRLVFETPDKVAKLATWPLAYYAHDSGEVGELTSGLPEDLVRHIFSAPPLNEADARMVRERLAAVGRERAIPLPLPQVQETEAPPGAPAARLTLTQGRFRHQPKSRQADELALAELSFDYPGLPTVSGSETPPAQMRVNRGGSPRTFARLLDAEAAVWRVLQAAGLESYRHRLPDYQRLDGSADCLMPLQLDAAGWLPLLTEGLAALEAADIEVVIADDFPFQLTSADDWFVDVQEEAGSDWFDLDLGVMIAGERISLVPPLVRLIANQPQLLARIGELADDETIPVALDERRILPVPVLRLRAWLLPLLEFIDGDRPRLSRHHAAVLATLEEQPAHWLGGERLRAIGQRLRDFSGIASCSPAPGFCATLRPYQQAGLDWLQFLREYDLAGILADDMGLGKTVQTLAHLHLEKACGRADRPSLVVAPTSLMANWRNEAAQFTPELKVLTLHGPDRARRFDEIAGADIVLTTYPLLVRDQETLLAQEYHLLVLDEAQFIKNPKAKSHQMARRLRARHRLSLTGTPLENHLGELWAQFDFLMPGFLGNAKHFGRVYRAPIEKQGDTAVRQGLAERVRPFLLRRTKEQVLTELPPRSEIVRWVELEGGQRDLYESLRVVFDKKLRQVLAEKGAGRSQIMILDALLKLRQVCCDPRLVKLDAAQALVRRGGAVSAKLTALMEMLEELLDEGRKVLLFSQFTSMLGLIELELDRRKLPYAKLTGQTRDRETPIGDFQEGRVPLFLISLKAGGTGLNLTAADTVIHYDPWWNPAAEEQATARAHRMGQDKPVFVYKLLTQGTVEEKILALQERKKGLADLLVKGGTGSQHLISAADLDVLFQPIATP